MTGAVLGALLSHWLRHRVQAAMLLLGLALATALWTGVQAINAEARASYAAAEAVLGQDALAAWEAEGGGWIEEARFAALRREGVALSPVVEGRLRIGGERVVLLGVDPVTAPPVARVGALVPEGADILRFITPPGVVYAATETVSRLAGEEVPFELRAAEGIAPGTLIADVGITQGLLGAEGRISRLMLWPGEEARAVPEGLVLRPPGAGAEVARLTDSFHLNLTAFGLLAFAVGLFIAHAAAGLAFEQRRGMFRTLRAIGVPGGVLAGCVLAETVTLSLVAGVVGVALGYVIAAALLPGVAATLGGLYGAEVAGVLSLRWGWVASGLGMAVGGAVLSALAGLWRLVRLPVLEGAKPRAWAQASLRGVAWQGLGAVLLALLAVALAVWGRGLVAGFGMLAALLLAAALAVPVALVAVLALLGRVVRGVRAEWLVADARQAVPGLSLALMALMLALAANVGVGTMVGSFRATFTGWLDQRLVAEVYATARDEAEGERMRDWLAARGARVLPVWSAEGEIGGRPGAVFGVADDATYREHWPLLAAVPGVWDRLAAGEGALVNEQLARGAGLWPGAAVSLPGGHVLEVLGVYSDYGNPRAQAMIGIGRFLDWYPEAPRLQHAVRTDDPAGVIAGLVAEVGLPEGRVSDQAAVKALSLSIFERTFAVTGALNLLTLGVAGVALVVQLVALAGMRLVQVAPVWAVGMDRAALARAEAGRVVLLSAAVAVLALPVGLVLAWVLLAVVNVEAFGWRLPMRAFPWEWLRLGLMAVAVGVLAAAVPVRRLMRTTPAAFVRVFAQER